MSSNKKNSDIHYNFQLDVKAIFEGYLGISRFLSKEISEGNFYLKSVDSPAKTKSNKEIFKIIFYLFSLQANLSIISCIVELILIRLIPEIEITIKINIISSRTDRYLNGMDVDEKSIGGNRKWIDDPKQSTTMQSNVQ
ncbi:hypothetical protein RFI_04762, partial [Reticulomyxa filosa]